ncbi:MAG: zf-HC2 domain-containing protein [Candidatus Poribacteria bacterium]
MKCSKYKKLLVEFADGHLDHLRSQEIRSHIEECQSCKKELDDLRSSMELMGNSILSDNPKTPEGFSTAVLDRLYQEQKESWLSRNIILGVAFVICLLVLGMGLFLNINSSKQRDIWIEHAQLSGTSIKAELPKKIVVSEFQAEQPKIIKKTTKSSVKNKNQQNQTTKVENAKSDEIMSIELIKLLNQTLEIIEGDEQECEIAI